MATMRSYDVAVWVCVVPRAYALPILDRHNCFTTDWTDFFRGRQREESKNKSPNNRTRRAEAPVRKSIGLSQISGEASTQGKQDQQLPCKLSLLFGNCPGTSL